MIGDMLYRKYLEVQEASVPEAKTTVGAAVGENEAYDLSQASRSEFGTGHKRLDVSDEFEEVEFDEIVEEPVSEELNRVQKVKVVGGHPHVKILFCTSWNYRGTYMQLEQLLK